MRRIVLFQHISLDGYFEAPGHSIDWATASYDPFSTGEAEPTDGILLGHRTYDLMKGYWPTPEAQRNDPEVARFMNETQKYAVSHSPFDPGWEHAAVISGDVVGEIRRLKEAPGATIMVFGSNTLCVTLMEEGLLDEIQVLVNPIVLGKGTSLFEGLSKHVPLTLIDSRTLDAGALLLTYRPQY